MTAVLTANFIVFVSGIYGTIKNKSTSSENTDILLKPSKNILLVPLPNTGKRFVNSKCGIFPNTTKTYAAIINGIAMACNRAIVSIPA